jgi:hypothetical protein
MFISPNSKGCFFSLSPENLKGLELRNPIIQSGDIWKIQEVLENFKKHCTSQNQKFDLKTFFNLPKTTLFFNSGEFGKQRLRGISKMDSVGSYYFSY